MGAARVHSSAAHNLCGRIAAVGSSRLTVSNMLGWVSACGWVEARLPISSVLDSWLGNAGMRTGVQPIRGRADPYRRQGVCLSAAAWVLLNAKISPHDGSTDYALLPLSLPSTPSSRG